jgi:hypothetical protein
MNLHGGEARKGTAQDYSNVIPRALVLTVNDLKVLTVNTSTGF